MKANISNIQNIVNDIPNRFVFENTTFDNYKMQTDLHFAHGWRDVVIPTCDLNTQKLSDNYVLENDIVTRLVIDLTPEEIAILNTPVVATEVPNMNFRLSLIHFGIFPSLIDTAFEYMINSVEREEYMALWNFANTMERNNTKLINMALEFGINSYQLDEIFKHANTL